MKLIKLEMIIVMLILVFIASCAPPPDAGGSPMGFIGPFLPFVLIIILFYFLIIRPQNKRLKAQKEMIQSLAVGDEIIASGGIACVITKMSDDFLTVRANDIVLTIQRESVSNVLPKGTIKSL